MDRLSVEGRRMEELGEVDVVVVEGRIVMGDNKPVSLLGAFLLFLGSVGNLSLRLCLSHSRFRSEYSVQRLRHAWRGHDLPAHNLFTFRARMYSKENLRLDFF